MGTFKGEIDLGQVVEDSITGFRGVVTAAAFYENGNVTYCVEKMLVDTSELPCAQWICQTRLFVRNIK